MPMVNGKSFSYDEKGKAAAKKAAVSMMMGKTAKPMPMMVDKKKKSY